MTTIPSTPKQFNKDASKFFTAIGNKNMKPATIRSMWKCLGLRYLGLKDYTDAEQQQCAVVYMSMNNEATRRGWIL